MLWCDVVIFYWYDFTNSMTVFLLVWLAGNRYSDMSIIPLCGFAEADKIFA